MRKYSGLILSVVALLFWITGVVLLGRDPSIVVRNAEIYRTFLRLSIAGALLGLAGIVATLFCQTKAIKIASFAIGTFSFVACAFDVLTPY